MSWRASAAALAPALAAALLWQAGPLGAQPGYGGPGYGAPGAPGPGYGGPGYGGGDYGVPGQPAYPDSPPVSDEPTIDKPNVDWDEPSHPPTTEDELRTRRPYNPADPRNRLRHPGGDPPVVHAPPEDIPTLTHYDLDPPCQTIRDGGGMVPTQGVFEDDHSFAKVAWGSAPQENSQIIEQSPGSYHARLPMVEGRDTVLIGIHSFRRNGTDIVDPGDRHIIQIKLKTNCSYEIPVKVRFEVEDSGGRRTIYTTRILPKKVPLAGNALKTFRKVTVTVPVGDGIPPRDVGPFTLSGGSYYTRAELIRPDDSKTGIFISTGGGVQATHPPLVQFVPTVLRSGTMDRLPNEQLKDFSAQLAGRARKEIPDYYPIVANGLPIFVRPLMDLSSFKPEFVKPLWWPMVDEETRVNYTRGHYQASLGDRLTTGGILAGAQRVVVLLRYIARPHATGPNGERVYLGDADADSDWHRVYDEGAVGVTLSSKVVIVRVRVPGAPSEDDVGTIAHELVHTLPHALWSGDGPAERLPGDRYSYTPNMLTDCGRDYHPRPGGGPYNIAEGLRIRTAGALAERRWQEHVTTIMGPSVLPGVPLWIDQCTYAHLIGALFVPPDPDLWLVHGFVADIKGKDHAELTPIYDLVGSSDVTANATGSWTIAVLGAGGRPLASYGFEPMWYTEENLYRVVIPISFRVPVTPGAQRIEIRHGDKTLATRDVSGARPTLAVETPRSKGGTAHVRWRASSPSGRPLLASVYYSPNGGQWYNDQLFEGAVSEADVTLDPAATVHAIKVIVTDGGRSSEQIVRVVPR